MNLIQETIKELTKKRDAVILAHYYVPGEVQAIADYVGDSYYLSKLAAELPNQTIVFCGVGFMGESAKILSPKKTILLPAMDADCPMAHMAEPEEIRAMRARYDDLAVVCYINSTAATKAEADVCVTSSNALGILRKLPQKNIFFIPDENLGRYLASQLPEKQFYFNGGFCPVHAILDRKVVEKAKQQWPGALVLAHPECTAEVLALADYIGSTKGIIEHATSGSCLEYIICTDEGIRYELEKKNPQKQFHFIEERKICENMQKVTLEKVAACLQSDEEVFVNQQESEQAYRSLERMLELAQ